MLFNRTINNTDDHERNFSFMRTIKSYQLAPAYDLVVSMATGEIPRRRFYLPALPAHCFCSRKNGQDIWST